MAYILFGSLRNVTKSGRVPGLVGRFAEMIQMKPIVKVSTGGFEVEKIVRTSKRAFRSLNSLAADYIESIDYPYVVEIAHGDVINEAEEVRDAFLKKYPDQPGTIHRLSGVVGVHSGPDLIGYTVTPDYEKIEKIKD